MTKVTPEDKTLRLNKKMFGFGLPDITKWYKTGTKKKNIAEFFHKIIKKKFVFMRGSREA